MKKPSSRLREEIAKLQEQLKLAETREAERIGRLALRAGLGEVAVEDGALVSAFEEIASQFRKGSGRTARSTTPQVAPGATSGPTGEA